MINEQGLNVRVLNIDSRKRSAGTAQDCEITLGSVLTLPAGAVAWVTAVSVPFGWLTTSSLNNKIYVTEHITNQTDVVPHVQAAGNWTYSSGTVYTWTKLEGVSHTYEYTDGSETRLITFTEWTAGSTVVKMTETRPGTTIHYTYDRATTTFTGVEANVTWVPVNNQTPFHVVGNYPVPAAPAGSSRSEVVEMTPAHHEASGFVTALAAALTNKPSSILPKPVSYHATISQARNLTLSLHYNDSPVRYDFQGMWNRTGSGAGNGPKQIVRDYRHLWESTTYPEYVVSPEYDFAALKFNLRINGVDAYTGFVEQGSTAFQGGKIVVWDVVTMQLRA